MKKTKFVAGILMFLTLCRLSLGGEIKMPDNIKWLGHSSILVEKDGRNIFIDPWKLKTPGKKADLILITHSHPDHYSPADIKAIAKTGTVIAGPADVIAKELSGTKRILSPWKEIDLGWVKVTAAPAHNLNKQFHPKVNGWLGFIIKFADSSIYVAGDTDFIPEMKNIRADIVILPVGGTYTMDAREAAEAVNAINPKVAIPIHFGDIVGSKADAEKFASLVKTAQVKILIPER